MRGAKFMQDGADVSKGADYEVAFTSEWQVVKVVTSRLQTTKMYTDASSNLTTTHFYRHDLGYTPMFFPYSYTASTRSFEFFRTIMTADNNWIHWYLPGGSPPASSNFDITIGLQVFAVNLRQPFDSNTSNPTPLTSGASGRNYGMQLVADGKDVGSSLKDQFTIDTGARSPQIHAVSYGDTDGSGKYYYTHDLPYQPMYFVYAEDPSWPGQLQIANNFAGISVKGNTIIYSGTAYQSISIVVLKEPFDVSENDRLVRI